MASSPAAALIAALAFGCSAPNPASVRTVLELPPEPIPRPRMVAKELVMEQLADDRRYDRERTAMRDRVQEYELVLADLARRYHDSLDGYLEGRREAASRCVHWRESCCTPPRLCDCGCVVLLVDGVTTEWAIFCRAPSDESAACSVARTLEYASQFEDTARVYEFMATVHPETADLWLHLARIFR